MPARERPGGAGRVCVRARPAPAPHPGPAPPAPVLHFIRDNPQMIGVLNKPFTFYHVFRPDVDQSTVFELVVQPLMEQLLQGYNCTLIAYGSTGTGKTYTMGT